MSILSLVALPFLALHPLGAAEPRSTLTQEIPRRLDVNTIDAVLGDHGSYGLVWPKGSGHVLAPTVGIWVGAKMDASENPTLKVAEDEVYSNWGAGPIVNGTGANYNPFGYYVYKIRPGDTPSNPDYDNWPVELGAPADSLGNPRALGDMTLWTLYNDRSPLATFSNYGIDGTDEEHSMGLEVRQTACAIHHGGPGDSLLILKYRLFNKGFHKLHQMYLSFYADANVGGPYDDVAGCDTALDVGYAYNGVAQRPGHGVIQAGYSPPANDPFSGVSGIAFHGGLQLARDFTGDSQLADSEVVSIELRFDPAHGQHAYAYRRGAGDMYEGFGTVPFTAWDVSTEPNRQINVAFIQNSGDTTDTDPPRWLPDNEALGGREYLFPLKSTYSDTELPQYTQLHLRPDAAQVDMMYAFWLRRPNPAVGPQAGDVLRVDYFYVPADSDTVDSVYGHEPPCVGWVMCQGPQVDDSGTRLGMTAFTVLPDAGVLATPEDAYNLMRGLVSDGTPMLDESSQPTPYLYPGDPETGTGRLDHTAAAKVLMISTGPFEMLPGDSQDVVVAVVVAQGDNRLNSVTRMRSLARAAHVLSDAGLDFTTPVAVSEFAAEPREASVRIEWTPQSAGARVQVERSSHADRGYTAVSGLLEPGEVGKRRTFVDPAPPAGTSAYYRLRVEDEGGVSYAGPLRVSIPAARLALAPPGMNPVSGPASVRFQLPGPGRAIVSVYAADGRRVQVLADGAFEPGWHAAAMDGSGLPSGIHFLRIEFTSPDGRSQARSARFVVLH